MTRVPPASALAVVLSAGLIVVLGGPTAAHAHWFGFAFDAFSGAQGRCFVTRPGGGRGFRIAGDTVTANFVCRSAQACNARRGRIQGTLSSASLPEQMTGTLSYPRLSLVCDLGCEVTSVVGDPPHSFWACTYTCPAPARVRLGTFTIQRR